MNLPVFCIRRPAFTIVISLVMVIVGIIGFSNLPVRWIPNVTPPEVTIDTSYPGANARLVEHDVTKVIEDTLSGINGIDSITSNSRQGSSEIYISFKLGRNMDAAVEDVRSSLERVRGELPREVQNPVVLKTDPNSSAILYISIYDSRRSARELSDYVDKYLSPAFETIDGVGSVGVYGKQVSSMQIRLDPAKMMSASVTVDDVTRLLQAQNASVPSGQIRGRDRLYSVLTDISLATPEQFESLILRDKDNQVIRLKDIAEIKLDAEDIDSVFRINGKPAIALGIIPQSSANPLDVENNVKKVLKEVKRTLPAGMQANIVYNQADYIRASIHSVYESLLEAVIFVWLVILVFLCNFRATWIPIITIPVCLVSTFAIQYFMGFSINTITLMALVLAIGLVVDDAIVMLENISRHIEQGMAPFNAALKGSGEMVFPVIAMTLTLAAVYAPIAFTPGLLGVLFREFTFTLAGAVMISGIIALTLTPMMCARLLKSKSTEGRYQRWFEHKMTRLQEKYRQVLMTLLQKRKWVVGVLLLVAVIGFGVYRFLPAELAPSEDMGMLYGYVGAPRSASFAYTDGFVRQLEEIYANTPEIESYLSIGGMHAPSNAFQFIILKPRNQRKLSTLAVVGKLNMQASTISGVNVNIFPPPPPLAEFVNSDDGGNVGLAIMTSGDYEKLQQSSQQMVDEIKKNPKFLQVDHSLKWNSVQFQVNIDRDRAADLKVSIPDVADTISTLIAGRNIGKANDANVNVQVNQTALANPNVFQQLYVRNDDGGMVPLGSFLAVKEATTSEKFAHYERMRADTINATLAPDFKLADAVKELRAIAKRTLPDDMKYSFTGEAKSFLDSDGKTGFTFLLALVFIYLVLVAQFESFIDPLIIMFTVPFAVVGALLTLKLFGGSLNIYSNIGLITLIGLIAKHGILITEFANRRRREGSTVQDAVIEAAMLRLRPILMTTAAMVLGALPLAFAFGPGGESRQQIGLVVTGGLLFGTFFSLVVVPVAYSYLAPFRKMAAFPDDVASESI